MIKLNTQNHSRDNVRNKVYNNAEADLYLRNVRSYIYDKIHWSVTSIVSKNVYHNILKKVLKNLKYHTKQI